MSTATKVVPKYYLDTSVVFFNEEEQTITHPTNPSYLHTFSSIKRQGVVIRDWMYNHDNSTLTVVYSPCDERVDASYSIGVYLYHNNELSFGRMFYNIPSYPYITTCDKMCVTWFRIDYNSSHVIVEKFNLMSGIRVSHHVIPHKTGLLESVKFGGKGMNSKIVVSDVTQDGKYNVHELMLYTGEIVTTRQFECIGVFDNGHLAFSNDEKYASNIPLMLERGMFSKKQAVKMLYKQQWGGIHVLLGANNDDDGPLVVTDICEYGVLLKSNTRAWRMSFNDDAKKITGLLHNDVFAYTFFDESSKLTSDVSKMSLSCVVPDTIEDKSNIVMYNTRTKEFNPKVIKGNDLDNVFVAYTNGKRVTSRIKFLETNKPCIGWFKKPHKVAHNLDDITRKSVRVTFTDSASVSMTFIDDEIYDFISEETGKVCYIAKHEESGMIVLMSMI